MLSSVQLLDASPVDLFTMCSQDYLHACKLPDQLCALGLDVEVHIIASGGPGTTVSVTGNINWSVTDSLTSAPPLHVLLVPGPHPDYRISDAEGAFIRKHVQSEGSVALLSVCTGIFPLLQTGLLAGCSATAPRGILPLLRTNAQDVDWVEKRWVHCVRDGGKETKIWTSGGITNGLEMTAAFIREWLGGMGKSGIAEIVLDIADVGARGQDYGPEIGALGKMMNSEAH